MDMSGGGMDMGSSSNSSSSSMDMGGGSCKISMLWNWYTVDTCFLSSSWHNRTLGMYAGSVVGVFFLVVAIEAVRRVGREWDRKIVSKAQEQRRLSARSQGGDELGRKGSEEDVSAVPAIATGHSPIPVPSWPQHVLRSVIYGSQFTAAFLVMLLGMYYNGGILLAIFIGQTVGYFAFGRDTLVVGGGVAVEQGSGCCC